MDKDTADRIIGEYVKSLYGFSLNKAKSISSADELASRIVLQVYQVLLQKDSFADLNSYIFKIAHNVWVRYIDEKMKSSNHICIDDVDISSASDIDREILESETAGRLRREIAFLSQKQREIVVLYYYKGLKIEQIAEILNMSAGTIKWHLFESKKELKKGMETIRSIGNLGINPIRFSSMGHSGSPGKRGDTQNFLSKSISQNIAYAAYHQPLTINEIAQELGISPVFIQDEVSELEEYGFMDRLPGGRYQTNILITEFSEARCEALHILYEKYAEIVVNEYFTQFLGLKEDFEKLRIYYPDNDYNTLLWSLIPYSMKGLQFKELEKVSQDKIAVLRKDGGNYTAFASIGSDMLRSFDQKYYDHCGEMVRGDEQLSIMGWQINTYWSKRGMDWRDNVMSDYTGLYLFVTGSLPENDINIDTYRRLIDKCYLIKTESGYKVNIVYCQSKKVHEDLDNILPKPSNKIKKVAAELDRAVYEINRVGQPQHMYKNVQYVSQNSLRHITTYILKNMLDKGLIKEPCEEHKMGITTILFIDR